MVNKYIFVYVSEQRFVVVEGNQSRHICNFTDTKYVYVCLA